MQPPEEKDVGGGIGGGGVGGGRRAFPCWPRPIIDGGGVSPPGRFLRRGGEGERKRKKVTRGGGFLSARVGRGRGVGGAYTYLRKRRNDILSKFCPNAGGGGRNQESVATVRDDCFVDLLARYLGGRAWPAGVLSCPVRCPGGLGGVYPCRVWTVSAAVATILLLVVFLLTDTHTHTQTSPPLG